MYAIIADGGRQYKVEEGQMLEIDFRDVNVGDTVSFDRVLAVSSDRCHTRAFGSPAASSRPPRGPEPHRSPQYMPAGRGREPWVNSRVVSGL